MHCCCNSTYINVPKKAAVKLKKTFLRLCCFFLYVPYSCKKKKEKILCTFATVNSDYYD